jgi:hypothetical protein
MLSLDKSDTLEYVSFLPEEIDYWLNESVRNFVKTRYSGLNQKHESFEQTQKRTDDLRTLVKELKIDTGHSMGSGRIIYTPNNTVNDFEDSYVVQLPNRYWFTLGESVKIAYVNRVTSIIKPANEWGQLPINTAFLVNGYIELKGVAYHTDDVLYVDLGGTPVFNGILTSLISKNTTVIQCTSDTVYNLLDNPYSEHILHYYDAKPLRLFKGNTVQLITDGNYYILHYNLRYLEKPQRVNILTETNVLSGSIAEGYTYQVDTDTINYNNNYYNVGQTFIGHPNISTFTGTGTINLIQTGFNLPEHTHDELIKLAVSMALENTENRRYQSQMVEVNKME